MMPITHCLRDRPGYVLGGGVCYNADGAPCTCACSGCLAVAARESVSRKAAGEVAQALDLSAIGRSVLIDMVSDLRVRVAHLLRDENFYLANLTATQARCTELLVESRELKRWIRRIEASYAATFQMPGWFCRKCAVFNGEAKEVLRTCRSCDGPRAEDAPS